MNPAVTVVLTVHNAERTLATAITRMLELGEALGRHIRLVLVDDGSLDGTYETACELARRYPQIRVLRQPFQQGLGAALDLVRPLGVGHAVVHDGVTALDVEELSEVLRDSAHLPPAPNFFAADGAIEGRGSRRTPGERPAAARSAAMGPAGSFRWLRLDEPTAPRRSRASSRPADLRSPAIPLPSGAMAFTGVDAYVVS